MRRDKDIDDPVSRKLLKRKVLERWENEGGRICADPGNMPQYNTPGKRGRNTPALSHDGSTDGNDNTSIPKKAG